MSRRLNLLVGLLSLCLVVPVFLSAQPDVQAGKDLFRSNCAACHNRNMKDKMTGPALGGTQERWSAYPQEDLYAWIRNSSALAAKGHPLAQQLVKDWAPVVMTPFENLTDDQIASLLLYIDAVYTGKEGDTAAGAPAAAVPVAQKPNNIYYWLLLVTLLIMVYALARVIGNMKRLAHQDATGEVVAPSSLRDLFSNKGFISFVIFALVVLVGYTTTTNGIAFGRQQNYAPEQPIKFSHATHAGLNKIDCNYCHDGARRSKHSVIPATNTCMNCHKAVKNGTTYGTAELTKIYVAAGFDPNTDKYFDNTQMTNDDLKAIYTKWIGDQYVAKNNLTTLDEKGQQVVTEQWDGIVNSLTHKEKPHLQGPIEWIRIHNMPDHVYFNHAQHTVIGKIECQRCHGKVEEMPVVKQYAPLSMGWCINCHRQTEVSSFGDNNYYLESFKRYHEDVKSGKKSKVTVEDIGGLECQKCHY